MHKPNPIVASIAAIATIAHGAVPCNICGTAADESGACANDHTTTDQVQHAQNATLSLWAKDYEPGSLGAIIWQ